jgi:hypothetical protein
MNSAFQDRFEMRELIDRWSDAVTERDCAERATCFTADGIRGVGGPLKFSS